MNKLFLTTMTGLLVAAAAVGIHSYGWLPYQTASKQYDDPAIVVCEHFHRESGNIPNGEYKRINSEIVGSKATFTYTISVLNTKPTQDTKDCIFKKGKDSWSLVTHHSDEQLACIKFADSNHSSQFDEAFNSAQTEAEKRRLKSAYRNKIKGCIGPLRQAERYAGDILTHTASLVGFDIYPIKFSKTKLSVRQ